jgi:hypothetical protein
MFAGWFRIVGTIVKVPRSDLGPATAETGFKRDYTRPDG